LSNLDKQPGRPHVVDGEQPEVEGLAGLADLLGLPVLRIGSSA
jgi:hypothetical protein